MIASVAMRQALLLRATSDNSSRDKVASMSQQNVEIVRRVSDAFAAGDSDTLFALVAPEIEWDFSHVDTWLEEKMYRGYDGIAEFFGKWVGEWDDYSFEVEDIIDAGDRVVAIVRDEGRGKSSGIKLERRHAEVWTVRDGKVIRIEPYDEKAEALAAVGLEDSA
jgi:ketosteroid isomerase-like protein